MKVCKPTVKRVVSRRAVQLRFPPGTYVIALQKSQTLYASSLGFIIGWSQRPGFFRSSSRWVDPEWQAHILCNMTIVDIAWKDVDLDLFPIEEIKS